MKTVWHPKIELHRMNINDFIQSGRRGKQTLELVNFWAGESELSPGVNVFSDHSSLVLSSLIPSEPSSHVICDGLATWGETGI